MRRRLRRGALVAGAVALVLVSGTAPATAVSGQSAAPATLAHHRDDHHGGRPWSDEERDDRERGRGHARGRDWDEDNEDAWNSLAGFAANNGGAGFWVLTKAGRVVAMEGAPDLGSVETPQTALVAIAGHPSAEGFWVLAADGTVFAFGAADDHGSARFAAIGLAPHRTGDGYWIAAGDGRVQALGTAAHHGDARASGLAVKRIVARDDADGYYLGAAGNRWLVYPQPQHDHPGHGAGNDKHHDKGSGNGGGKVKDKHKDRDRDRADEHDHRRDHTQPPKPPRDPVAPPPVTTDPNLATVQGITVDRQIAGKTRRLLRAAARAGMKLGGWGHRSHARQIELRRAHCGTTRYAIYEKPSSSCRPPTARPGSSMHEVGRAIDFYKRGAGGRALPIAGTREFRWLKRNAARFGFYNLPSEPWHWSTNGR